MAISLGTLALDPIAAADIAAGEAGRSVNSTAIEVNIGTWRNTYDGVAAPFFLGGLFGATLAALNEAKSFDFFCLDDPAGGRVLPGQKGRVRVRLTSGEEHELSVFDLLRDTFQGMMEVAEFLASKGHPDGAALLLKQVTQWQPSDRPGWPIA